MCLNLCRASICRNWKPPQCTYIKKIIIMSQITLLFFCLHHFWYSDFDETAETLRGSIGLNIMSNTWLLDVTKVMNSCFCERSNDRLKSFILWMLLILQSLLSYHLTTQTVVHQRSLGMTVSQRILCSMIRLIIQTGCSQCCQTLLPTIKESKGETSPSEIWPPTRS